MSNRLLFVCAMNVCRSPLMAFTFAEALADDSDRTGWTVSSRGTGVTRKDSMCDVSASLITGTDAGGSFAATHVSTPIVTSQLASQDMVLVATRSERGKVAQLSPELRGRTFTVREAIALGRPSVTAAELDMLARSRTTNQRVRLGGYPQLLHMRRGLVPMPIAPRPIPFLRRAQPDPLDIPDVHHEKMARHQGMLKELQAEVRTLHVQIKDFLASRVSVG